MDQFNIGYPGDDDHIFNMKFGASTAVGVEGAYFFNKYIGVGGRLRINSSPVKGWDGVEMYAWKDMVSSLYGEDYETDADFRRFVDGDETSQPLVNDLTFTIKSDHLTEFAYDLGVYFNLPLSKRFALGSKLLVGRSIMQEVDLDATATGGQRRFVLSDDDDFANVQLLPETYTAEWDYFTVGGNKTMKVGTGLSLTYAYKENYAWKLFFDYDYTRKKYTMTYNPGEFIYAALGLNANDLRDIDTVEQQSIKKNRHSFILGGSFTINF